MTMKYILAIFLSIALPAQADVVAVSTNKAGGLLLLTDIPCRENGNSRVFMSTQSDGANVIYGCASGISEDLMLVMWDNGGSSVFPFSSFKSYTRAKKF